MEIHGQKMAAGNQFQKKLPDPGSFCPSYLEIGCPLVEIHDWGYLTNFQTPKKTCFFVIKNLLNYNEISFQLLRFDDFFLESFQLRLLKHS